MHSATVGGTPGLHPPPTALGSASLFWDDSIWAFIDEKDCLQVYVNGKALRAGQTVPLQGGYLAFRSAPRSL